LLVLTTLSQTHSCKFISAAAARRKNYGWQFWLVRQHADFFGGSGASRFWLAAAAGFGG